MKWDSKAPTRTKAGAKNEPHFKPLFKTEIDESK